MSSNNLQRFLGGSVGSVLIRLLFLSLLVGAFLAFLGLTPLGIIERFVNWLRSLLNFSWDTLMDIGRWIVSGAFIVVPVWLLFRLFGRKDG